MEFLAMPVWPALLVSALVAAAIGQTALAAVPVRARQRRRR